VSIDTFVLVPIGGSLNEEPSDGSQNALKNYLANAEAIPDGRGKRSRAAMLTNSARDSAFIFRIRLPRCAFTVISLIPNSPPTCLFGKPTTTNAITSRSRAVRPE
jgi:hypothetical protein